MKDQQSISFPCPQCGDTVKLETRLDPDPITMVGERHLLSSRSDKEIECKDCSCLIEVNIKVKGLL